MVRTYVKKTSRGSWPKEDMEKALQAVLEGTMGYKTAAATFKIPKTTLERRVKIARTQRAIAHVEVSLTPKITNYTGCVSNHPTNSN